MSGTHIYAVRYPADLPLKRELVPSQMASEQAPPRPLPRSEARPKPALRQAPQAPLKQKQTVTMARTQPQPQQVVSQLTTAPQAVTVPKADDKKESTPSMDYLFARDTMVSPPKTKSKC